MNVNIHVFIVWIEQVNHYRAHQDNRALIAYIFQLNHFAEKWCVGVVCFATVKHDDCR